MRRNRTTLLLSSVALIGLTTPWHAFAQEAPQSAQVAQAAPSPGAKAKDAQEESEQIVVTGNAHAEGLKKLDAAYSITSTSEAQIKQAAPSTTADLLKVVPGLFAESSSGESGPNIELRGFPGNSDAPFVTYLINGAPIYPAATLSFLDNSSQIRIDDMIERQEVELGGTATIFDTGQPGATVNLIQKTGLSDPDGTIRLTYGSGNLYRADLYYGGKLAEDWYGAIGGFYRTEDGIRDTQYPEADGGAIHANITHTFEGGQITVYANETKDDDAFFVGIPLAVTGGPGTGQPINFSSLPNFDALTGTLLGNGWRNVDIPNLPGGGTLSRDMSQGRGIDLHSFSFNFNQKFGDGWAINDVGGYNAGHTNCYCAFNYGNYLSGTVGSAIGTFGQLGNSYAGKTLAGMPTGVTVTGTRGTLLSGGGALSPNQQITSAQVWSVDKSISSFTNEVKLSKDIFPGNTLTAGVYYAHSTDSDSWDLGNNLLLTFQNNAQPINVTVTGSDGKIYNVTKNGFASASFFQINENWTGDNVATYLQDEWKVNDQLRFDAGVRREYQKDSGQVTNDTSANIGGAQDLWGVGASVPCAAVGGCPGGNYNSVDTSMQAWSWTAGGNYYLTDNLAVYARASVGYHLPSFDDLRGSASTPQERAAQYEIGVKTAAPWYSASVNAYHIQFWATPTQLIVNNNVEFFTTSTKGYGLDFEGSIRPPMIPNFEVDLTGDYLHAKNDEGPSPASLAANPLLAAELAGGGNPFDGAAVPRQPVFQSRVTPAYTMPFEWGSVKLYTTWTHSGPRYADLANSQPLPAYDTLDAGVLTYLGDRWDLLLTATNLTNEIALTEGAAQQTGSGVSNGIGIARPEFGRSIQFSATMHF